MNKLFNSLLILSLFLISCESESDLSTDKEGRLIVRLTDAPFPHHLVREANVAISKIEIRSRSKGDDEENDPALLTISEEDIKVNLLDLTNGITMTLANADIPAAKYDLVRLHTTAVNLVLEDGKIFNIRLPNAQNSSIDVFIKPYINVKDGLTSDLLLDFDVSRSFLFRGNIEQGSIHGVIYNPFIKAADLAVGGTLKGYVFTLADASDYEAIVVNKGGGEYPSDNGNLFISDAYSQGGNIFESSESIGDRSDVVLYQTEDIDDFSYEIPVPRPDHYDIKLHYEDLYFGKGENYDGAGTRSFNVHIKRDKALSNFDILSEASLTTALTREFREKEITNGFASFHFVSLEDNAKISDIEVILVEKTDEENIKRLHGAQVSVYAAGKLNTTTFTDENGMFTVMGLPEGKYDIEVELNGYKPQRINGVPITQAQLKTQDFIVEPYP